MNPPIQSLEKKSEQRVFCRYNKKVSAKDILEADDTNKKNVSINFIRVSLFNVCFDFNSDDCMKKMFCFNKKFILIS